MDDRPARSASEPASGRTMARPFRDTAPMRWLLGIGLCLAAVGAFLLLAGYDVTLMRWRYGVIRVSPDGWFEQVLVGFRDFGQVVPVAAALIVVATYDQRRKRVMTAIVLAQLLAAGGYNGGKRLIARHRPYAAIEEVADLSSLTPGGSWIGWRPGNRPFEHQSFPSGHSASAFALAAVLAWFYPRLGWMFWILAVGCAGSRYLDAVHWPSDCWAGAVIGGAAAWFTLRLCVGQARGTA